MSRAKLIAALKRHHGSLSAIDRVFEGERFDYVAKFDSGLDAEEFGDETGVGGPSDYVDGIFCMWFNGGAS